MAPPTTKVRSSLQSSRASLGRMYYLRALDLALLARQDDVPAPGEGFAPREVEQRLAAHDESRALGYLGEAPPVLGDHDGLGAFAAYPPICIYRDYSFH